MNVFGVAVVALRRWRRIKMVMIPMWNYAFAVNSGSIFMISCSLF